MILALGINSEVLQSSCFNATTQENPHRPRSMVGWCSGVSAGNHKAGMIVLASWSRFPACLPRASVIIVGNLSPDGLSLQGAVLRISNSTLAEPQVDVHVTTTPGPASALLTAIEPGDLYVLPTLGTSADTLHCEDSPKNICSKFQAQRANI